MSIIRWDNIAAPQLGNPGMEMASAREGFMKSLDTAGKVFTDRDTKLADQAKQSYLDAVGGAQTPEQLAEMQKSGFLTQIFQSLDPKTRGLVRGAEEAKLGSLQQQVTAGNTYTDALDKRAQEPLVQSFNAKLAGGNFAGAEAEIGGLKDQAAAILALKQARATETAEANAAALAPGAQANAVLKQQQETLTLNNARKAATDSAEVADITSVIDKRLIDHTSQIEQSKLALGSMLAESNKFAGIAGTAAKIPLDAAGMPDVENMTNAQKTQVNLQAKAQGLPSLNELFEGDTKVRNNLYKELVTSGVYSPAALTAGMTRLNTLNTANQGASIGNDATISMINDAKETVVQEEEAKTNWYTPGSSNAMTAYDSLSTKVSSMFKNTDMTEDEPDIQAMLYRIASEGVEYAPGKFIMPSEQDIIGAIHGQMGKNNLFNNSRSEDILSDIKRMLNKPAIQRKIAKAEDNQVYQRRKALKDLLSPKK